MKSWSTVLVGFAALCWGLSGGIGGVLMVDGWDPFVLAFYRRGIGLVLVLAWLALRPGGSGLGGGRLWFWSTVAGLGVAGNFAFYFVSISRGSVAVAATLMYCAPIFVYLVSFAIGLERPTVLKWAAIVLVMFGVLLLTRVYDAGSGAVSAIGVGAGLLAGLSYALFIFGFKYAAPHGSPQAVLAIALTVLVAILVWPADSEQRTAALSTPDWPLFAALGVLGAGLSFIVYIVGLRYTAPAIASIVAMVEPVTAALFGVAVLGEELANLQILGMVVILITVTIISVQASVRNNANGNNIHRGKPEQFASAQSD